MTEDCFSDNIRQTRVVMKYEFKKYSRGKMLIIFAMLMGLVLVMSTALTWLDGGFDNGSADLAFSYASSLQFLILLGATLLVSGTIVSEFEDRTALALFTKPIKKWSIYFGKFFIACIVGFMFVFIYYAIMAAICLAATGSLPSTILVSMGLALAFMFGMAGLAIMFSSMAKKFSIAAILTFASVLMVAQLISSMLYANAIDPWFMIDIAGASINGSILGADSMLWRDTAVMLVWGLVACAAGYITFRRRGL
ncbi:MAG: ABC transporter permease [Candidatus Methanoplasma sp.]|nr:ABC transporter permease [Candidatus Methanoplasma sp.]